MLLNKKWYRWTLIAGGLALLSCAYMFQQFDYAAFFGISVEQNANTRFVINKTTRFLINDAASLLLIFSIFNEKKYLRVGMLLFLAELIILLPLYFALKLYFEGDSEISSPLLSQLHRMIINPLLMFVLMLGLFYQDFVLKKKSA